MNDCMFEFELELKELSVLLVVFGLVMAGALICSGAGLFEWDRMIHPPKKVNTDAMVSHTRKPFLTIFISDASFRVSTNRAG